MLQLAIVSALGAAGLPDFCRLTNATFKIWDKTGACSSCRGDGEGVLVPGADCDGVRMSSKAGMAATFYTQTFEIEPTVVYNVTYAALLASVLSQSTACLLRFLGGTSGVLGHSFLF